MFWIHAIWKYVNCTLVSLLSKCICNHSSTKLNLQVWSFYVLGLGWSPCEREHACYFFLKQETEDHSAVLSLTILSDLSGRDQGKRDILSQK